MINPLSNIFRNIISASPVAMTILDVHLTFIAVSEKWLDIYGFKAADFVGKSHEEVFSGRGDLWHQKLAESLLGNDQVFKEEQFERKDGKIVWLKSELKHWLDEEGRIGGLVIYSEELSLPLQKTETHALRRMTNQQHLEEAIYQSEAQFKQAFEHSLIGMALISPEGNWKRVNKSLCAIVGYSEEELVKLNVQDITHPDDLKRSGYVLDHLAQLTVGELKFEKRYLHKDGHTVWVVIATTLLRDRTGHPLHFVSQIEDITKRKEIENDLVLSEKKYRTIFENVQDVFYQTNKEGLLTEISPSIEQHSGYTRQELIGKQVNSFYYYPQDRQRMVEKIRSMGSVIDFEVRLKTKNGELRYASVNARLITENGVVMGIEGSMRDVTTRKFHENALRALNTELKASNEQKNKLLSIIGHDLRNPISGSLQLLDLTLTDFESSSADDVHNYLSMMKQELSNANNLLEDLLTWAKSQFNAVSFNPVEIEDVQGLVDKCILTISHMATKKSIEIITNIEPGLKVHADIGMLETVLRNLLSNAIKFSNKGQHIRVEAHRSKEGVKFAVRDTGKGIPEDKMGQLFDKNINYTTFGTSGEKGTGLGLNLCYDFVLKHGGELWAESEEGVGSTFYFVLNTI